ncbi:MAG: hypothetical protein Q8T04_05065 [Bacteroidota bacterium]|nr:hypothetical protein [Bacteroidota bacterium]
MNKEIIDLANYIFENYDLSNTTSSCHFQLFLSVYALALLNSGEVDKGVDLFHQVKFKNISIPENMQYYIKIRYMLIETEFLVHEGKRMKAHKKLEKIKNISQMLKFNYFYNKALNIEKSLEQFHLVVQNN